MLCILSCFASRTVGLPIYCCGEPSPVGDSTSQGSYSAIKAAGLSECVEARASRFDLSPTLPATSARSMVSNGTKPYIIPLVVDSGHKPPCLGCVIMWRLSPALDTSHLYRNESYIIFTPYRQSLFDDHASPKALYSAES